MYQSQSENDSTLSTSSDLSCLYLRYIHTADNGNFWNFESITGSTMFDFEGKYI